MALRAQRDCQSCRSETSDSEPRLRPGTRVQCGPLPCLSLRRPSRCKIQRAVQRKGSIGWQVSARSVTYLNEFQLQPDNFFAFVVNVSLQSNTFSTAVGRSFQVNLHVDNSLATAETANGPFVTAHKWFLLQDWSIGY